MPAEDCIPLQCTSAMPDLIITAERVSIKEGLYTVQTKTQYFISPSRFAFNSAFLIKFDGQYSYWSNWSKRWIHDPTLSEQYWVKDYLNPITEGEAEKITNEEEKIR